MNNNNKKGRPTLDASKRRDKPLIIRLSEKERAIIKAKCEEAGYQAAGAFVRDVLVSSKVTGKVRIPLSHIQLSVELQRIAGLISKGQDIEVVVQKLVDINNRLLGIGEL
ncbi:plasmid mobilization protein [Pseudomonas proteolytica]|uniref:plasmid mobilization protein n=1 Tax=Pseudomonas proteolytica TaxID=219574 RepID=UPI000F062286